MMPGCSASHASAPLLQPSAREKDKQLTTCCWTCSHLQIDIEYTHACTHTGTSDVMDDTAESSQQVESVRVYLFCLRGFICWMTSPNNVLFKCRIQNSQCELDVFIVATDFRRRRKTSPRCQPAFFQAVPTPLRGYWQRLTGARQEPLCELPCVPLTSHLPFPIISLACVWNGSARQISSFPFKILQNKNRMCKEYLLLAEPTK